MPLLKRAASVIVPAALAVCVFAASARAAETAWDKAQAWAREADWRAAFFDPTYSAPLPQGEWRLRATISYPPEHGALQVYVALVGAYTKGSSRLSYRASLADPERQLALLHATHPEWTAAEGGSRLLYAEVLIPDDARSAAEVKTFEDEIRKSSGPILPDHPESIFLHPTSYCLEVSSGGSVIDHKYCAVDYGGEPEAIEQALLDGARLNPLAVTLCRTHNRLQQRWREAQEKDGFAGLRARLDMPALGVTLFDYALKQHWDALAAAVLDWGLDVRRPAPDGSLPLVSACEAGNTEIVRLLIERGADVNLRRQGRDSVTPLAAARRNERRDIEDLLLSAGAKE